MLFRSKAGIPITKVTIAEQKSSDSKFGNQYVEVDAGSNAYFIIYENVNTKDREDFKSLATHKAIERIVRGEALADEREGYKSIILSPNELVYVPTTEEINKINSNFQYPIDWSDKKKIAERIYKVNDFSGGTLYFTPHRIAKAIKEKEVHTSFDNKSEKTIDNEIIIKKVCIKLNVDRLGNFDTA